MEGNRKIQKFILGTVVVISVILYLLADAPVNHSGNSAPAAEQGGSKMEENGQQDAADGENDSDFTPPNEYAMAYTDNEYPDESACLSPKDYEVYHGDGFSFGYPKYLFNYGYADDAEGYYELSYGSDYIMKVKVTDKKANARKTAHKAYVKYMNKFDATYFDRDVKDVDSNGMARALIGGYYSDTRHGQYVIIASDGSRKYELTFEYPETNVYDNYKEINYVVDCVYRYCSFSGGTYKPRSWKKFLADDMGTKK